MNTTKSKLGVAAALAAALAVTGCGDKDDGVKAADVKGVEAVVTTSPSGGPAAKIDPTKITYAAVAPVDYCASTRYEARTTPGTESYGSVIVRDPTDNKYYWATTFSRASVVPSSQLQTIFRCGKKYTAGMVEVLKDSPEMLNGKPLKDYNLATIKAPNILVDTSMPEQLIPHTGELIRDYIERMKAKNTPQNPAAYSAAINSGEILIIQWLPTDPKDFSKGGQIAALEPGKKYDYTLKVSENFVLDRTSRFSTSPLPPPPAPPTEDAQPAAPTALPN